MRRVLGALTGVALPLALLSAPAAGSTATGRTPAADQIYVVALRAAPLATYRGGVEGYAATASVESSHLGADDPKVAAYRTYLRRQQSEVLRSIDGPRPLYSYTTTLNGFAATLSRTQVKQLQGLPEVVAVEPNRTARLDGTSSSAAELTRGDGGAAEAVRGPANAPEGVVIGVIDSGIWPENPSFAGIPDDPAMLRTRYPEFRGACVDGERWSRASCNMKVVSARYFVRGFGAANIAAADFLSARDGSGHGSHTAATAAGNRGVDVTIERQDFGHLSGAAPAAALAVYKACWTAPDPENDGCTTADTVKAIDQAVDDGVDVINYSAGSPDASATDVVERAFFGAAAAGVFVATSAGDTRLREESVAHPSPWVTTVGATDHAPYQGTVRLGDGQIFAGAMIFDGTVRSAKLVYAADVPAPGASSRRAALCFPGSIDARAVASAIVVCDRGVTARLDKSGAVARAGGAAMVLVNRQAGVTEADLHAVPTVHLDAARGRAIKAYIRSTPQPTARLDGSRAGSSGAPQVAEFSARGPAEDTDGYHLKPDLTAPGVSIVAAVAPPSNFGRLWDAYSGTSMATPQVAGLAALIAAKHPSWSPAAVKSAMMTSATSLAKISPWAQGAGDLSPQHALDPGLVYDAGSRQWSGYLRSLGRDVGGPKSGASQGISGLELNSPAISIGRLIAREQVHRVVTNVSGDDESYIARADAPRGVAVSVSPAAFTLAPGESQQFTVAFNVRQSARYQRFAVGSLTWRGSHGHVVRSPLVVRPELVEAPDEASGNGRRNGMRFSSRAGVTGRIHASVVGLVGAFPTQTVLKPGEFSPTDPVASSSTTAETVRVPPHTAALRIDAQAASPGDDLDLFLYRGRTLVASAASGAATEQVTIENPQPGEYAVYVNAAASATGNSTSSRLTTWVLPSGGATTASVSPHPVAVTGGRPFDLVVDWSNLDRKQRWFGYVAYRGSHERTYLTID